MKKQLSALLLLLITSQANATIIGGIAGGWTTSQSEVPVLGEADFASQVEATDVDTLDDEVREVQEEEVDE